jgi:histidinol dehydrogenase
MKIYRNPSRDQWAEIVERPHLDVSQLNATVAAVLQDVKEHGNEAVIRYEEKFDHVKLASLAVTDEEIDAAVASLNKELYDALVLAHNNIRRFHESQMFKGEKIETAKGVSCWQKSVPIEKVGLYIPGGTAPLFSTVLMLATPAKIAGCKEIVLCTPPTYKPTANNQQLTAPPIHPAILAAAKIAGVNRIYKTGGVQAIGAMAYGTETIPKTYKIFGPGNQYVMAAKQQVSLHDAAIDMPAGPSEVCVIADDSSNAEFVAADLLSQAEHGIDSQVLLITTSEEKMLEVEKQISLQLNDLPRKEIAEATLVNSKMVLVNNTDEAIALSNCYAPEHLIICTRDYERLATMVTHAGSVFLGPYACESAGDYASGTNHTLPTHGYATAYSGVCLDSFCRKVTFQHLSPEGIQSIGPAVETMADNEQLHAHCHAMTVRRKFLNDKK